MKKVLVLLMLLCSLSVSAQRRVFAQVTPSFHGTLSGSYVTVVCDLGSFDDGRYGVMVDENNEDVKFDTEVGVLNYMSDLGWELVDFEDIKPLAIVSGLLGRAGRDMNVHNYLFTKIVTDDAEITRGLTLFTKQKSKKDKKK